MSWIFANLRKCWDWAGIHLLLLCNLFSVFHRNLDFNAACKNIRIAFPGKLFAIFCVNDSYYRVQSVAFPAIKWYQGLFFVLRSMTFVLLLNNESKHTHCVKMKKYYTPPVVSSLGKNNQQILKLILNGLPSRVKIVLFPITIKKSFDLLK